MALPALKDKRGINPIHQKIKIIEEARVERARKREEKQFLRIYFFETERSEGRAMQRNATQRNAKDRA